MSNVGNKMSIAQYRQILAQAYVKNKYRNKPVTWTGKKLGKIVSIKFASIKEMNDGLYDIDREKRGLISELEFHKRFELVPKTETEWAVNYTNDRYYLDHAVKSYVSADSKSDETKKNKDYIIRRKLFKQRYPDILFLET